MKIGPVLYELSYYGLLKSKFWNFIFFSVSWPEIGHFCQFCASGRFFPFLNHDFKIPAVLLRNEKMHWFTPKTFLRQNGFLRQKTFYAKKVFYAKTFLRQNFVTAKNIFLRQKINPNSSVNIGAKFWGKNAKFRNGKVFKHYLVKMVKKV